jgi:AbrB family looped-hinge helix DNA binding protein
MSDTPLRATVRMNAQGRIVIPAEMRRALGFEPGEELVLSVRDGVMECQTQERLVQRFLDETPAALRELDLDAELRRLRDEERRALEHKTETTLATKTRRRKSA